GQHKCASAIAAGERIAPEVEVVGHDLRLGENFVDVVGAVRPDIVVDGSDSFDTRFIVDAGAAQLGVPVEFGALMQWSAQITVFDATGTYGSAVRLTDIFPNTAEVRSTQGCAEVDILGSVGGMVGAMFATRLATETINLIVGAGCNLVGRMLVVDALDMHVTEIPLAQPASETAVQVTAVSKDVLDGDNPPVVIDVRRTEEIVEHPAPMSVVHVPFDQLGNIHDTLEPSTRIVTLCRTGPRSVRAAQILATAGYQVVGYLDGGVEALQSEASMQ